MGMGKTGFRTGIACCLLAGLAGFLLTGEGNREEAERKSPDYIFAGNPPIDAEAAVASMRMPDPLPPEPVPGAGPVLSDDAGEMMIDHNTLRFFKSLEGLFPESSGVPEHLEGVSRVLHLFYPEQEARALFEIYKTYLLCEMDIARDMDVTRLDASDPMAVIAALGEIQEYRRARMGDAVADGLFGAKVKAAEYGIRRSAIVTDPALYGREKKALLADLDQDMWQEEPEALYRSTSPYVRYQEALRIYAKDIAGAQPGEARESLLRELRMDHFPEEAIGRLEAREEERKKEAELEAQYHVAADEILENPDLDPGEKSARLKSLEDRLFGDYAETFRNRMALIREGRP